MPRVKRGVTAKARHKKILKEAKGYYGARKVLADMAVHDKHAFAAVAEKAKAALA